MPLLSKSGARRNVRIVDIITCPGIAGAFSFIFFVRLFFIRFLYALRSEPIENTKLLRKSDICEVFGLTPPALKMRLKRAPESLPKPFTFPGSKIQYWTAKSVSEFIEKHSGQTFEPVEEPEKATPTEIKRKRGRPSYVSTGKRVPVTE